MAFSVRIDDVIVHPTTGHVYLYYTEGNEPLSLSPSGMAKEFRSQTAFTEIIQTAEQAVRETPSLLLLALMQWNKTNLDDLAQAKGRKCTIDGSKTGLVVITL